VRAKRTEARARVGMANLRQQQSKSDDAVRYLEPALEFYRQGGYRSETLSCLALLARVNLQKGDYAAAAKGQEELLRLALELNDQSQIALAHAERGSGLASEEKFTEALDHLNQAYSIYSSQGIQRSMGYNLADRAEILARLGRFDEARALLDQASAIANKPGGELKRLSIEVKLTLAKIALGEENFPAASIGADEVEKRAASEFMKAVAGAMIVSGLSRSYGGAKAPGKQMTADAVNLAKQLNDPSTLAQAQLAFAQALLLAGDSSAASTNALQAEAVFARLSQPSSQWQALLVAAQASQNLGDKNAAREYAVRAGDTLSKLEQRWGSENFNSYLRRADVQRFRKQLDLLTSST